MRFVRGWPLAVSLSLLAGCAVTPPQAISWGASAISYLATGKSLGDHALSAAVGQDCALLRMTESRPVCEIRRVRRPVGSRVATTADAAVRRTPTRAPTTPGTEGLVSFLVVASFPSVPQAMAYRTATVEERLRVLPFYAHGVSHYRIVAGPIREGEIHLTRNRLVDRGLEDPWLLTVCADTLLPPPCADEADHTLQPERAAPLQQATVMIPPALQAL